MPTIDEVLRDFVLPAPTPRSTLGHDLDAEITVTQKKLQILESPLGFFFPAENTKGGIKEQISKLRKRLNWLKMAMEEIPQLDFYFLGALDRAGLPAFILVPLDHSSFYFTAEPKGKNWEDLPKNAKPDRIKFARPDFGDAQRIKSDTLRGQFENAAFTVAKMSVSRKYRKRVRVFISANLKGGVIKGELRSKIHQVESQFDEIFLVLEAPSWIPNEAVDVTGKTMIVGWIKDTKQLFLIGVYNPIPVDQFLDRYLEGATMITPIK